MKQNPFADKTSMVTPSEMRPERRRNVRVSPAEGDRVFLRFGELVCPVKDLSLGGISFDSSVLDDNRISFPPGQRFAAELLLDHDEQSALIEFTVLDLMNRTIVRGELEPLSSDAYSVIDHYISVRVYHVLDGLLD